MEKIFSLTGIDWKMVQNYILVKIVTESCIEQVEYVTQRKKTKQITQTHAEIDLDPKYQRLLVYLKAFHFSLKDINDPLLLTVFLLRKL